MSISQSQPAQKTSPALFLALGVFVWLAAVYYLTNFALVGLFSPSIEMYLVDPLLWLSAAGLAYAGLKRWPPIGQSAQAQSGFLLLALLIGLVQGLLALLAGFLYGFGNSPYSHAILIMAGNLVYVLTPLLAFEFTRAFLAQRLGQKHAFLALLLLTLIFTVFTLPLRQLANLQGVPDTFRFVGQFALPDLAENMLATFLVIVAGPWPAVAYRFALACCEWLPPILPNLPWIASAFIGVLVPMAAILLLQTFKAPVASTATSVTQPAAKARPGGKPSGSGWVGWIIVLTLAVLLFSFNTGMFGYQPFLVSGPSMNPTLYTGDIVITRQVPAEQIQVGDIIRFSYEGAFVVHRVKEIRHTGQGIQFITRGDNNNVDDSPVSLSQYDGKSVLVIPKLGLIGVGVRLIYQGIRGG